GEELDVLRAAAGDDRDFFCQVPGIGPARARAIIGHLRRRYPALPAPLPIGTRVFVEVRDALTHAGVAVADAEAALLAALEADPGLAAGDPQTLLEALS